MDLILQNSMSINKCTCVALCLGLGLAFNVAAGERNSASAPIDKAKHAVDEDRQTADEDKNEGMQKTLNLNFSPERREKLRKALDQFSRSIDPSHDQIEERRRAMQDSIEARFFEADTDGDSTIDRQEATEKLPQIARHFNSVDTNQDNLISLGELVDAQARILERRKAAEAALELEKQQKQLESEAEAEALAATKQKNKQAINGSKKKSL